MIHMEFNSNVCKLGFLSVATPEHVCHFSCWRLHYVHRLLTNFVIVLYVIFLAASKCIGIINDVAD